MGWGCEALMGGPINEVGWCSGIMLLMWKQVSIIRRIPLLISSSFCSGESLARRLVLRTTLREAMSFKSEPISRILETRVPSVLTTVLSIRFRLQTDSLLKNPILLAEAPKANPSSIVVDESGVTTAHEPPH